MQLFDTSNILTFKTEYDKDYINYILLCYGFRFGKKYIYLHCSSLLIYIWLVWSNILTKGGLIKH